jgi:hypothetical protein
MATSVCTEDVECTGNAQQIFGGKMKNAYCTVWAEVVDFFSFSSFHKEMLPLL